MSGTNSSVPPDPAADVALPSSPISYIRCIRTGVNRVKIWVDLFPPTSLSIPRFLSIVEQYDRELMLTVGRFLTEYSFFLIDWEEKKVARIFSTGEVGDGSLVVRTEDAWRQEVARKKAAQQAELSLGGKVASSDIDPFVALLLPLEFRIRAEKGGERKK